MADEIINKVAQSGLISVDLEDYFINISKDSYDVAQNLWQGIALKEKDFRLFVKEFDWSIFKDKYVNLYCSVDAVIPSWGYMLLTTHLEPFAKKVIVGTNNELESAIVYDVINNIDINRFINGKVIVKGCSKIPCAENAMVLFVQKIKPVVQNLMFGEPCSTVPLYKKPK